MLTEAGAFKAGDLVNAAQGAECKPTRARILCFRYADNPYGHLRAAHIIGADLLFENGRTGFNYLHDLTRRNPDKLAASFQDKD